MSKSMNGEKAERRRYRKVFVRLWRDEDFRRLSSDDKVMTLYILTGPQANRVGLYVLSEGQAAEDLDILLRAAQRQRKAVCMAFGWQFDWQARVIWIPSWWRYNEPTENANNFRGALSDLNELPRTPLLAEFCRHVVDIPAALRQYIAAWTPEEQCRDGVETGSRQCSNCVETQEQEQEQEPSGRSLLELWNSTVSALTKVQAFTADRLRRAKTRLEEHDLAWWAIVFRRMDASDFLTGRNPSREHPDWRADIDFVLKPGIAEKVLEGKYDSGRGAPPAPEEPDARGHLPPCRSNTACNRRLEQEIEARKASLPA